MNPGCFLSLSDLPSGSALWNHLVKLKTVLKLGVRKRIKNGNNTNFWKDPWIETSNLSSIVELNPLKLILIMICGKKVSNYINWEMKEPKWNEFKMQLRRDNLRGQRQVNWYPILLRLHNLIGEAKWFDREREDEWLCPERQLFRLFLDQKGL